MPVRRNKLMDSGFRLNRREPMSMNRNEVDSLSANWPLTDINQFLPENGVSFDKLTINKLYANQDMQSSDFVTGTTGWQIQGDGTVEFNDGTFRGDLVAGSIAIPDSDTTANSFHVEADADTWWGATQTSWDADNDNAKAYVKNTGVAKFQDVIIQSTNFATQTAGWRMFNDGTLELNTNSAIFHIFISYVGFDGSASDDDYVYMVTDSGAEITIYRFDILSLGRLCSNSGSVSTAAWFTSSAYNAVGFGCMTRMGDYLYLWTRKAADSFYYLVRITIADGTITEMTGMPGAILTCGTGTSVIGTWNAVTDGSFEIYINGVQESVFSIDFSGAADMDAVAAIIQTDLRTATTFSETVVWSTDHFIITSAADHASGMELLTAGLSGTDISGVGGTTFMAGDSGSGASMNTGWIQNQSLSLGSDGTNIYIRVGNENSGSSKDINKYTFSGSVITYDSQITVADVPSVLGHDGTNLIYTTTAVTGTTNNYNVYKASDSTGATVSNRRYTENAANNFVNGVFTQNGNLQFGGRGRLSSASNPSDYVFLLTL